MRVLVVNQTGQMSGAEHSLLTLLDALRAETEVIAAVPAGDLARALDQRGIPVRRIRGTDASFRLHPVHTPRALAELTTAAASTAAIARKEQAQVVHANTTRAGLVALAARRLGGPPVLVHIRDWVPPTRTARLVMSIVRRNAATVVANSRFAASQLPPGRAPVEVIPNPVDLGRFDPARIDRDVARARLGIDSHEEALCVVGQLTPWKGQAEAVHALAAVRRDRPGARLLIVGSAKFASRSTRFDNRAYDSELRSLPARLGIEGAVSFLGERKDVSDVLAAVDVLLVPSWREAFGRVAVEGMAMGVPVVVTSVGGPAEVVRDGVDGLVLPPQEPARWAAEITALLADRPRRERMGAAGRERARAVSDPATHAASIEAIYRRIAR
jgi:L-malate glycosyltransferase